jgi:hypothetical protein
MALELVATNQFALFDYQDYAEAILGKRNTSSPNTHEMRDGDIVAHWGLPIPRRFV